MSVSRFLSRQRHRLRRGAAVAAVLSIVAAGACGAPTQRKPLEMEPIGTVKNLPRTPVETGDASVTSPNSGTPSVNSGSGAGGPCETADIENLEDLLKQCSIPMPKAADLSPLKEKIEVRVAPSATSVQAGGRIDLQVALRNKSNESVVLYFTGDPNAHFEVEATDAKGKRADLPKEKWPGYPKGVKPEVREAKAMKITLEQNGTARVKVAWEAVKTKWAPEKVKTWEGRGFPRTTASTLPPGKYNLKVVLPLLIDVDVPKVSIDVT